MKIENVDADAIIAEAKRILDEERGLSPELRSVFHLLLVFFKVLLDRATLNSRNSSKPPAADPNRKKQNRSGKTDRRPGGQPGRVGKTLTLFEKPDKIEDILVDREQLPHHEYTEVGFERRQVIDLKMFRFVTEYRAQVLEGPEGERITAPFPEHVKRAVQYGTGAQVNAVYMSQYQLLPYERTRDWFESQADIPISVGTLYNFNKKAYEALEGFEEWTKSQLRSTPLVHADETGINTGGKRYWLHCQSNGSLTYLYPHTKRGGEAMDTGGVLPSFRGTLCHDHWKPYYGYPCLHALCNAHHLRELERAWEQDGQRWAKKMQMFLIEANRKVAASGGSLPPVTLFEYKVRYRKILEEAEGECPAPAPEDGKKRGRLKRSKSRNLLERLRNFEDDVLRSMEIKDVPFTNNQGENDLRMTKVQQKISGCFRSFEGVQFFCRIRSYLSTCRKHDVSPDAALTMLFEGKRPDFMDQ